MKKPLKDVGASVRARLLRLATERGEDFQLLLTRHANERLLFRLAASPHASKFVLKGAALFTLWTGRPHRATRDLDLLGVGESTAEHVHRVLAEVLATDVGDDGVLYDAASLAVGPIREDQKYGGVRATMVARVTSAQVRLQVDVGFGDAITPAAEVVAFPTLLDFEAPRLRAYPRETVVAEKLDAMLQLDMANSRMKDFYDVALLARMFDFDGELLVRAIRATFERRRTRLPSGLPVALTSAFATDPTKVTQWRAFARKAGAAGDMGDLPTTIAEVAAFAGGPLEAAAGGAGWPRRWPTGGPWSR